MNILYITEIPLYCLTKFSGVEKSKQASTVSMGATARHRINFQPVQNILLICSDNNKADCQNAIIQLR